MLLPLLQPSPAPTSSAGVPASESRSPPTKQSSSSTPALMVCDGGIPAVELHWFLLASLLPPLLRPEDPTHSHCPCCNLSQARRSNKTVLDIFTWALCFNRYVAALCAIYPGMLPRMMGYENTIIQPHLQFTGEGWRIYDCAFHAQAASRLTTNWRSVDASLYAHFMACQPCQFSVCQFCCSSGHRSSTCLLGVNDPASLDPGPPRFNATTAPGTMTYSQPICISRNAGSCRHSESCRYHHVCSSCGTLGHRSAECRQEVTPARGLPPFGNGEPTSRAKV